MRAVVLHGVEIPESLLAREAQNHPRLSAAEARTAAGHALATKALLLHRAAELGLTAEPELDEDGREETEEAALIRAVLEAEVEVVAPSEAECRRVYDAQRARFRSPELYEASHILIETRAPHDEAETEAARRTAAELQAILARDVGAFAEVAHDRSDCPSGAVGGSLGQLRRGDLVAEVEAALIRLEPGEVSKEPVRSRFGWHVLKLERRIDGRELPFEIVADQIRLHLESRAWGVAASRYVLALAEAARGKGVAIALGEDGAVVDGAACLGDLIGGAAAERLAPWLRSADPALYEQLCKAASDAGVELADFTRRAAADFVEKADDERWTQLVSAARDSADPALAALTSILRSKLAPPQRTFTLIGRRGSTASVR